VLPQSITESYKEITQSWQNGLRPLQQEQKKLFEQTKKKLIDLKRLLLGGKNTKFVSVYLKVLIKQLPYYRSNNSNNYSVILIMSVKEWPKLAIGNIILQRHANKSY